MLRLGGSAAAFVLAFTVCACFQWHDALGTGPNGACSKWLTCSDCHVSL